MFINLKYQTAAVRRKRQAQTGTTFSYVLIFVQGKPSYKHYTIILSTYDFLALNSNLCDEYITVNTIKQYLFSCKFV